MHPLRHLPPVMHVASLLRLLFPLGLFAAFACLATTRLWPSAHWGVYAVRVAIVAVNLSLVGLACILVVHTYLVRVRQFGTDPIPLASWQSQVQTIMALTAVPVCALVLAAVISPTVRAFQVVFPVSIVGAIVFLVVALSLEIGREADAG